MVHPCMMDMTISLEALLKIAGAVITISGAAVILAKPIKGLVNTLNKHDKEISELTKKVDGLEGNQKSTMSAILAMVNHMIDGNGIDGLKKVRDDLQKDLIEK